LANDHNNLEHGRPLLFDDAYSISYGEREFQFGFKMNHQNSGAMTSLGYGFAKNQELSIGFDASHGMGTVGEVSYFRNISREIENSPAFGLRVTAMAEPGTKPSGQLRMIATKALRQYDKLHLNLDFNTDQSPGVILGYSSPLGYPRKFDQTLLSEVAFQPHETSFGIGLRRQIDARSILDLGVRAGKQVQLLAGYSIAF
jgi:hypothetical protein